jgi:hypothetical protein
VCRGLERNSFITNELHSPPLQRLVKHPRQPNSGPFQLLICDRKGCGLVFFRKSSAVQQSTVDRHIGPGHFKGRRSLRCQTRLDPKPSHKGLGRGRGRFATGSVRPAAPPAGVPTKAGPADHRRDHHGTRHHHGARRHHHCVGSAIAKLVAMRTGAATARGLNIETREGE